MPKKREKTETKMDKVLSYLADRIGRWIDTAELESVVADPLKHIRRLRRQGYPIRIDWSGAGTDPKFMLIASAENACKFCRGRGCLSCSGTGISSKGGEENGKQVVDEERVDKEPEQPAPEAEEGETDDGKHRIHAGTLSVSVDAEQAMGFFEGAI